MSAPSRHTILDWEYLDYAQLQIFNMKRYWLILSVCVIFQNSTFQRRDDGQCSIAE